MSLGTELDFVSAASALRNAQNGDCTNREVPRPLHGDNQMSLLRWRRTGSSRACNDRSKIVGIFATGAQEYQSQFDRQVGFTLC
jgi:hypothetical protein